MKKFLRKLSAALVLCSVLVMMMGTCVFASSTASNPHFDFACGSQFSMHAGQSQDISFFCDRDYSVYEAGNTSGKTALASSGKAGNNTATVYIGADETSGRVVFYFYPKDDSDNYDTLIIDIVPDKFTTAVTAQTSVFSGTAQSANGTHTIIYDAMGCARAAFAIIGTHGFEKVSLGSFVETANGIYLTVKTPYDSRASKISVPEADKAAARALGINGLILNGKTVNWP